jgi:hypothetical protein
MAIPVDGARGIDHSPNHYRKHRKQLVENGTLKKQHAELTKKIIYDTIKKK